MVAGAMTVTGTHCEMCIRDRLIGMIDVVGYHHGNPVIGYCSCRRYWGNGYMTEALGAVMKELAEDGFDTFVIEAADDNVASNKVILKNGFKLVGKREARPVSYTHLHIQNGIASIT